MAAPALSADLDDCHVLALPAGTDIRSLAVAWFVGGTWEVLPVAADTAPIPQVSERRFRGSTPEPLGRPGRLRLTARAGIVGPWSLRAAEARLQGLPDRDLDLYALDPHVSDPLVLGWMTAAAGPPRGAGGRGRGSGSLATLARLPPPPTPAPRPARGQGTRTFGGMRARGAQNMPAHPVGEGLEAA